MAGRHAGRIRREELPKGIVELLDASRRDHQHDPSSRRNRWLRVLFASPLMLTDDIVAALDDAVDDVRARIAHGNKLVFDELAPLFVAFLGAIESGSLGPADEDVATVLCATGLPVAYDVLEAFQ